MADFCECKVIEFLPENCPNCKKPIALAEDLVNELNRLRQRVKELEDIIANKAMEKGVAGTCQYCSGGYPGLQRKIEELEAENERLRKYEKT